MKSILFSLFVFLGFSPYSFATENLAQAEQFIKNQKALFEENKGQVTGADASKVNFVYKEGALSVFLLKTGIAYQFNKTHYPEGYKHLDKFASTEDREHMETLAKDIRIETYRMDVSLVNANPNAKITTEGKSTDYIQYYNHNALDVHSYSKITYHEVYPNIDWVIYKTSTQLKYDFVVRPGGNPNQIKLQTSDVEDLTLNQDGSVTLKNRMGHITEQTPVSFQNGKQIASAFNLQNNTIAFDLDSYDPTQTLTIDPSLEWATYYGDSGYDYGESCATDGLGNVYLVGETSSLNNISTPGSHQESHSGPCVIGYYDAFLVKFNSSGVRQWATYYGAFETTDQAFSCSVDGLGNVYLVGSTNSLTNISTAGAHQENYGGGVGSRDAFLVKFNNSGVRQWATYYGESNLDYGNSCAVDGLGNVYLAGFTESNTDISSSGAHQSSLGGGSDAFLVKFNSSGIRQWGTYYGGVSQEDCYACTADGLGNVYLAGHTTSTNDISTAGAYQTNYGGAHDAFLVSFNTSGVRQWATYYGGSIIELAYACAADDLGNVYLTGRTESTANISSAGAHQTSMGGYRDAFLVKFNNSGVRQWATYYGGILEEYGNSCVADANGNVYLAGWTISSNNISTAGAPQTSYGGGTFDSYLVKFNSSGVRQWGTYFGGSSSDAGRSCALDGFGNVYLAGWTMSSNNISTVGAHQTINGGNGDAFLAKFVGNCVVTNTDTIVACNSYTWIDGNTYTESNNSAMYTYLDSASNGCDSLVFLNLTIQLEKPIISQSDATLSVNISGATYQWIDCTNENAIILGETSSFFSPNTSGDYAVIVTQNGCIDTSACYTVLGVSITKNGYETNLINVYPNPSNGKIYFNNIPAKVKELKIYNSMGQIVYSTNVIQNEIDLSNQPKGVYFVLITELKEMYRATVVLK